MLKKVQQLSAFLKKWMPLLFLIVISTALVVGYFEKEQINFLKNLVTPAVFLMLIPMMMNLVIEDLKLIVKDAKILTVAIAMNFILSPLLAYGWGLIFFQGLDPNFIAGWILKLTVPCSSMVVAWTGLAKGKIETALVIQVLSFLLAIVFIPTWMSILVHSYVHVDFLSIMEKVLMIIVLPLIIGVSLRELFLRKVGEINFNKEIKPFLPPLSTIGMYLIIFIVIALEAQIILSNLNLIAILVISIFSVYFGLFFISIIVSKKLGIPYENAIAIGYSTTAKNHGITIALAFTTFGGLAILPPAFAPILQIILMMIIYYASPRIRSYYKSKKANSANGGLHT